MKSGILLKIVGGLFIALALLNLISLTLPGVQENLVSPLAVLVRYSLMLLAGIGFMMLRIWGLYIFLFSVTINWVAFYTIYDGASRNYPLWLGIIGPIVVCAIFYISREAIKNNQNKA